MSTKDYLKYAFTKVLRDKRNIILLIVLIIGTITLLCALTYHNFRLKNAKYSLNTSPGYRLLYAHPPEEVKEKYGYPFNENDNPILSLNHVIETYPMLYNIYHSQNVFINGNQESGLVELLYGSENTIPKNIEGRPISSEDTGIAICSRKLILAINEDANELYTKYNILNDTITIKDNIRTIIGNSSTKTDEIYEKAFKIVGTYDSVENSLPYYSCYISAKDIKDLINTITPFYIEKEGYSDATITVIDDIKNVDSTMKELIKNDYLAGTLNIMLWDEVNKMIMISDIIAFVSTLTILFVTIFYYKKKSITTAYEIGRYKAIGCTYKQIKKINVIENMFLGLISFIISVIAFETIYTLFKSIYIKIHPYDPLLFMHSIWSYMIAFIIVIIIPIIISNYYVKKSFRQNVNVLYGVKNDT